MWEMPLDPYLCSLSTPYHQLKMEIHVTYEEDKSSEKPVVKEPLYLIWLCVSQIYLAFSVSPFFTSNTFKEMRLYSNVAKSY